MQVTIRGRSYEDPNAGPAEVAAIDAAIAERYGELIRETFPQALVTVRLSETGPWPDEVTVTGTDTPEEARDMESRIFWELDGYERSEMFWEDVFAAAASVGEARV